MTQISKDWTAEERIKLATLILGDIQMDIPAGRYSEPGRPNITTVTHILNDSRENLEQARHDIERFLQARPR
jgi:hypothetical protein